MNIDSRLKLSLNLAVVSGIFSLVVALLLLLNFWQVSLNDPLESKSLAALVQRLSEEPNNNELKQDIRNLDLLARKAYFNSQWQVKTGSYLLLFGAVAFALALRYYFSLKARIDLPEQQGENELAARILSQRWLLITGITLMVLAFGASFITVDHLRNFAVDEQAVAEVPAADSGIEVVQVGGQPAAVSGEVPVAADSAAGRETDVSSAGVPTGAAPEKSATAAAATPAPFPDAAQLRANSPAFRGAFGNGIFQHKNIPTDFDGASGKNILWKAAVPKQGYNSPVIWGDRIFLAGATAQLREVYCFDRNSGKLLWTQPVNNIQGSPATPPKVTEDTGLSAPTVAADGVRVYAIFATGDIIAFSLEGVRVWARNLGVPDNHYGHSSSLITWKDKLFVQYDTNKGRKLMALNVATGETVWETERKVKISWASPILIPVNGKYQVVLSSDPLVAGYDTETGRELWATNCMMGEVGPSPAFGEGLVFAGNEYARLVAINPADGKVVWENDEYLPEVASPVVAGGLLFIGTSYGMLVCYDAKSGEKLWEHDSGAGYYASPVVADNKLFAMDMNGKMQIFALSKEKKLLAEPSMGEKITTTPAFAEGRIYIRGKNTLYCIGNK